MSDNDKDLSVSIKQFMQFTMANMAQTASDRASDRASVSSTKAGVSQSGIQQPVAPPPPMYYPPVPAPVVHPMYPYGYPTAGPWGRSPSPSRWYSSRSYQPPSRPRESTSERRLSPALHQSPVPRSTSASDRASDQRRSPVQSSTVTRRRSPAVVRGRTPEVRRSPIRQRTSEPRRTTERRRTPDRRRSPDRRNSERRRTPDRRSPIRSRSPLRDNRRSYRGGASNTRRYHPGRNRNWRGNGRRGGYNNGGGGNRSTAGSRHSSKPGGDAGGGTKDHKVAKEKKRDDKDKKKDKGDSKSTATSSSKSSSKSSVSGRSTSGAASASTAAHATQSASAPAGEVRLSSPIPDVLFQSIHGMLEEYKQVQIERERQLAETFSAREARLEALLQDFSAFSNQQPVVAEASASAAVLSHAGSMSPLREPASISEVVDLVESPSFPETQDVNLLATLASLEGAPGGSVISSGTGREAGPNTQSHVRDLISEFDGSGSSSVPAIKQPLPPRVTRQTVRSGEKVASDVEVYERDLLCVFPATHSRYGEAELVRGKFPDPKVSSGCRGLFTSVSGSFRNMTPLQIPTAMSTFLSLGPKFMLPAFTQMCGSEVDSGWEGILRSLEAVPYLGIRMQAVNKSLRKAYDHHVRDVRKISAMDRLLLRMGSVTAMFLKSHRKDVALVEGDKGKLVGLMPRCLYVSLCDAFIEDGIRSGQYVRSSMVSGAEVLTYQKREYELAVCPFLGSHDVGCSMHKLFMPADDFVTRHQLGEISRMNQYAASFLRRVIWKVPVFRPSIKYHKVPPKLRPIVSKRHTPSISVGKAILFALGKVMSNYLHYDASLNVLRVDHLINDLYHVYDSNPEYGFCSFDVVSMFDNISMSAVMGVIRQLDMYVGGGCVLSSQRLLELISIDSDIFDVFSYTSPTVPGSVPQYIHQRRGIFMGGNTSSVYSDLFLSFRISTIKTQLEELGVRLVRKYVDDLLLYLPKRNFDAALALFHHATGLEFSMEVPVDGRLPYLDVVLTNIDGHLSTQWYRKPVCSNRLVNFHSVVPRHEVYNTFAMRIVSACRYDSGSSFLFSFHVILQEMRDNSLPRRVMRLCIRRAQRYGLGRRRNHKMSWLIVLSTRIYELKIELDFAGFLADLRLLVARHQYHASILEFHDDVQPYPVPPVVRNTYHEPGDPLVKVVYRGPRSRVLYMHLRRRYKFCTVVYLHDRYFGARRLYQKGVELTSADLRLQELLAV